MRRAVGMAGKRWQAKHSLLNRHCRQTQPADSPPGTGLETDGPQIAGLAANTTTAAADVGVGLSLAVQVRGGVQGYWQP